MKQEMSYRYQSQQVCLENLPFDYLLTLLICLFAVPEYHSRRTLSLLK